MPGGFLTPWLRKISQTYYGFAAAIDPKLARRAWRLRRCLAMPSIPSRRRRTGPKPLPRPRGALLPLGATRPAGGGGGGEGWRDLAIAGQPNDVAILAQARALWHKGA